MRLPEELLEAQGLHLGDEIELTLLDRHGRPFEPKQTSAANKSPVDDNQSVYRKADKNDKE
ncbi:MAG: hypothetical protein ACLFQ5_10975 [Oceanicaulis sp.]